MPDSEISRLSDLASGKSLCDMSREELENFLKGISRRGAYEALATLGLDDKQAPDDIKSIRGMLGGMRLFRHEMFKTTISSSAKVLFWGSVFGILSLFFNNHTAKAITDKLVLPGG